MMQATFISDAALMAVDVDVVFASAEKYRSAARPGVDAIREPTIAIFATSTSISTFPAIFFRASSGESAPARRPGIPHP